jgi:diphthine synthase
VKELVFIGLGLNDEKGISVQGLEEAKTAIYIFIELYTSLMPNFSLQGFETLCGRKIQVVSRRDLEEENGTIILEAAKKGKTVFLVPGDPFIATTHITLRVEAEKHGVKTRIIHGISIISAIISLSGLHNYKFGKTVTIPFPENFSETPYHVISQNRKFGAHTLCLLDLQPGENRFLTINQAITMLLQIEKDRDEHIITETTLTVGIARAGSNSPILKADFTKNLASYDFGKPPYCLIFPGDMHFMEIDSLITFADAPLKIRRLV